MGKAVAIVSLVVVCIGAGVLIGGLGVYYGKPFYQVLAQIYTMEATCIPRANGLAHTVYGQIGGIIHFSQATNKHLQIKINVTGLPKQKLGFHVHTYGVFDYNCSTAGGHFNPFNHTHAGPEDKERHAGDLGNIDASLFPAEYVLKTDSVATLFGPNSILGRSIVIHEREDDLKDQNSAGPRLACCTIQHNKVNANTLLIGA